MEVKKRLAKLIDIKSIVTIILTIVFAILAVNHTISGDQVIEIFIMVIGFYFGTQTEKAKHKEDEE